MIAELLGDLGDAEALVGQLQYVHVFLLRQHGVGPSGARCLVARNPGGTPGSPGGSPALPTAGAQLNREVR